MIFEKLSELLSAVRACASFAGFLSASLVLRADYSASRTFVTVAGNSSYGATDGIGEAARFNQPKGLAVDGAGNIYVADSSNCTIRKITPAGVVTTLAGFATPNHGYGSIDGKGGDARFAFPFGVAVDGSDNVYIADTLNSTIRKITSDGTVTTVAGRADSTIRAGDGTGSSARFNFPNAVAADRAGNVYVADTNNSTIRKISIDGRVTTFAGTTLSHGSADGIGNVARFDHPQGIAVDRAGNIYVADTYNSTIRKITSNGNVTTLAGAVHNEGSFDGMGSSARFRDPTRVAVDDGGNIYVVDSGNFTVRKITPGGVVSTYAGVVGRSNSTGEVGSGARFFAPSGVAVDALGNVFVADADNMIRKIVRPDTVTRFVGSAGGPGSDDGTGKTSRFSGPGGLAIDPAGNVYVADSGNSTIRKFSRDGVVTTLAGLAGSEGSADGSGSSARFKGPQSVATDRAGNLYVTDTSNSTIRKISSAGFVTTLAGLAGSSGSADGVGPAARFLKPWGIGVDSSGVVFVADSGNSTVRRITTDGTVTTLGKR